MSDLAPEGIARNLIRGLDSPAIARRYAQQHQRIESSLREFRGTKCSFSLIPNDPLDEDRLRVLLMFSDLVTLSCIPRHPAEMFSLDAPEFTVRPNDAELEVLIDPQWMDDNFLGAISRFEVMPRLGSAVGNDIDAIYRKLKPFHVERQSDP